MKTQDRINVMVVEEERLCFNIRLTAAENLPLKNNINMQEDVALILAGAPYIPSQNLNSLISVVGYQREYFQYLLAEEIREYLFSYPYIKEIDPAVLCSVINWIQDHKDFFKELKINWLVVFSGKEIFGITINSAKVTTFTDKTEWNEGNGLFLFERVLKPEPRFHN